MIYDKERTGVCTDELPVLLVVNRRGSLLLGSSATVTTTVGCPRVKLPRITISVLQRRDPVRSLCIRSRKEDVRGAWVRRYSRTFSVTNHSFTPVPRDRSQKGLIGRHVN